jgi:hypothetical protein
LLSSHPAQRSSVGSIAAIPSIVRECLLICPWKDGSTDGCPRISRLPLPRRKVVTAVGMLVGGRPLSSRNERSLDRHGVFSPVVRVSECAQDDGFAVARVFDREDRLNYPLPARLLPPNPLCATSFSSVLARMVVLSVVVVQANGSLLCRKVITAPGILNGGRPPHSHNKWFSWRVEDHGMISPAVRVSGFAERSSGARVGCFDRDGVGCVSGGASNTPSSRRPTTSACQHASSLNNTSLSDGVRRVLRAVE